MQEYRIGAVARLTGLTVHNLRVWERRHQAVETTRTDSGRRVYSEADVARLKLLKECVDQGLNISTIAHLSDDELKAALGEMSTAPKPVAAAPQAAAKTVCVVGSGISGVVDQYLQQGFPGSTLLSSQRLDELNTGDLPATIDLLILECPSVSALESKDLGQVLKQIQPVQSILVYRYARQQDIAYLRSLGMTTVKAPWDKQEMRQLLRQKLTCEEPAAVYHLAATPPERLYSEHELSKAASITASIDCECPQHLAEIIRSMTAFEAYSQTCAHRSEQDRDLHRFIHLQTAQARAIMEELMRSVLAQEGIDLDLIAV